MISPPSVEPARAERPLTVLQSIPPPHDQSNPFSIQLTESLPGGVRAQWFSWPVALRGRYDVFHMHWPEITLRGSTRGKTRLRQALFLALLVRLRVGRIPIVRTIHNAAPHEGGGLIERGLLAQFDRQTSTWIRLNDLTVAPRDAGSVLIPHGHYRDWFAQIERPDPITGRLLYFGLLRRYKGVIDLLHAYPAADTDDTTLRVVGRIVEPDLADPIQAAVAADPRISARLEFVTDAELAQEIGAAELVVLPFRDMHNSGSLLLALSLDRPVLVPDSLPTRALAEEVGPGWVIRYSGEFDATAIDDALRTVRSSARPPAPDLSARDWSTIGAAHERVYRQTLAAVNGPKA